MSKKTKYLGREEDATGGTDRFLSPRVPYTGDGYTTREIHDKPDVVTFRKGGKGPNNGMILSKA